MVSVRPSGVFFGFLIFCCVATIVVEPLFIVGDDHGTLNTNQNILFDVFVVGDAVDDPGDHVPNHVPVHPASGLGPSFDSQRWRPPRDSPYYYLDLP